MSLPPNLPTSGLGLIGRVIFDSLLGVRVGAHLEMVN
jgi:hypothetical protein